MNNSKQWEKVRTDAVVRLLNVVNANIRNGEMTMSDEDMAKAIFIRVDTLKRILTHAKEMKVVSTFLRNGLRVYTPYQSEQPKPKSTKLF